MEAICSYVSLHPSNLSNDGDLKFFGWVSSIFRSIETRDLVSPARPNIGPLLVLLGMVNVAFQSLVLASSSSIVVFLFTMMRGERKHNTLVKCNEASPCEFY